MDYVAGLLALRPIQVYEVATFYSMYDLKPVGKHKISVCTNISCMLRGGYGVLAAFEKRLGVNKGGTAGEFTIIEEECIAACANAPAIVCGTRYFLDVQPEQVDMIIDELKRDPRPEGEVV
jgi:NADH:ubiquinone oxidoreductase subunit E